MSLMTLVCHIYNTDPEGMLQRLYSVPDRSVLISEVVLHNALMHALNGNTDKEQRALDRSRKLRAEKEAHGKEVAQKAKRSHRRSSDRKKANKKKHATDGNTETVCRERTDQETAGASCSLSPKILPDAAILRSAEKAGQKFQEKKTKRKNAKERELERNRREKDRGSRSERHKSEVSSSLSDTSAKESGASDADSEAEREREEAEAAAEEAAKQVQLAAALESVREKIPGHWLRFVYRVDRGAGVWKEMLVPSEVAARPEELRFPIGPYVNHTCTFEDVVSIREVPGAVQRMALHARTQLPGQDYWSYWGLIYNVRVDTHAGALPGSFGGTPDRIVSSTQYRVLVHLDLLTNVALSRLHANGDFLTVLSKVTAANSHSSSYPYDATDISVSALREDELITALLCLDWAQRAPPDYLNCAVDWSGRAFSRQVFRFLSDAQPAAPGVYYRGYNTDPADVMGARDVVHGAGFLINKSTRKLSQIGETTRDTLHKAWEYRKMIVNLVGRVPCFPDRTNMRNLETGAYVRLGSHNPQPDKFAQSVFDRVEAMYMDAVRPCPQGVMNIVDEAVAFLQVHPEYSAVQKQKILRAAPEIERCIQTGEFAALLASFNLTTFPKVEEYGDVKEKTVRHIVCPDVVFRFVLSLLTSRLEEAFVKAHPRAWVKHLSDDARRQLMADVLKAFVIFAETDFTTMEQNVKGVYREAEMRRFKHVFQGHWLEGLANAVFGLLGSHFSLIKGKGYVFVNHMCRNSGEGPTSIGNGSFAQIGVTAAMVMAAYALGQGDESDGVALTTFIKGFEPFAMWNTGLSEGDDGIFGLGGIFTQKSPEEVKAAMDRAAVRLGLLLKFEVARDYKDLHFCRNTLGARSIDLAGRAIHGYLLKPTFTLLDKLFLRHDTQAGDSAKDDVQWSTARMHSFLHSFWPNKAVRTLAAAYKRIFPKEWGRHFQMLEELRQGKLKITEPVRQWLKSLWGHEELLDDREPEMDLLISPRPGSTMAKRLDEIGNTVSAGLHFAWDESAALTDVVVKEVIAAMEKYADARKEGDFTPVPVVLPETVQTKGPGAANMKERVIEDVRNVTDHVVHSRLAKAARGKLERYWEACGRSVRAMRVSLFLLSQWLLFFAPYSTLVGARAVVSLVPFVAALPPPVVTMLSFFLVVGLLFCFFAGVVLYCRILLGPRGGWFALVVCGTIFLTMFGVLLWFVWPAVRMCLGFLTTVLQFLDELELPAFLVTRDESRWLSVPRGVCRLVFETARGLLVGFGGRVIPEGLDQEEEEDDESLPRYQSAEAERAREVGMRPISERFFNRDEPEPQVLRSVRFDSPAVVEVEPPRPPADGTIIFI